MPKKTSVFRKKQTAVALVLLGIFLILFIVLFLYFNVIRISGFPELLPSNQTIGYAEFPLDLKDVVPIRQRINETFKIDLERDIIPWAGERGAVAFLESNDPEKMSPFLLIQTRSLDKAFAFLKNYGNPKNEIKGNKLNGIATFRTPALHFAFISDILLVSPSQDGLNRFISLQSTAKELSRDSSFIKIRRAISGDFFVYVKPEIVPANAYFLLAQFVPKMPPLVVSGSAMGIAADKTENKWHGTSYLAFDKALTAETPEPYRASLLPVIPSEFDLFLSGQNLANQFKKIDELLGVENKHTPLSRIIGQIVRDYFPGLDFEKEIAPLISREFAATVNSGKALFVTEMRDDIGPVESLRKQFEAMEKIRKAFEGAAGRFTPKKREVILPDGTKAFELVPDPSKVKPFYELFSNIEIQGFLLGKDKGIYDSFVAGKWLISNDLSTLKKALLLIQESGRNLRDSALYKESLQPILKNPELLGVSVLPSGVFSFSKRTFVDHMETNFMFVLGET